ncbi:MAG: alpha/beta hydrolase [Nitrososphaeraceae archaeon]
MLSEKSSPPSWKQLPTWYQVSYNDRIIPPDAERMFAKQMNATTISLLSSHASPVSHPSEIAQLILNATEGHVPDSSKEYNSYQLRVLQQGLKVSHLRRIGKSPGKLSNCDKTNL